MAVEAGIDQRVLAVGGVVLPADREGLRQTPAGFGIAALLCLAALAITVWQFVADPATVSQAYAIAGIVVLSLLIEIVYRLRHRGGNAAISP